MSRFAALGSLVNELNPLAVGKAMEQFNRVSQQRQKEEIFNNLLRQHNQDIQNDSDYRKSFNALAKRDPNALMSAKNLSQIRAKVGSVRQNMQMVNDLEKRLDAFATSPQGRSIGFNAEFERQRLRDIGKMIQENPEIGNQALFQHMGILSAAMQSGQQESLVQQFMQQNEGKPIEQTLAELRDLPIPRRLKDQVQMSLIREAQIRNQSRVAEAKASGLKGSPAFRALTGQIENVTDEEALERFENAARSAVQQGALKPKEADSLIDGARERFQSLRGIEDQTRKDQIAAQDVSSLFERVTKDGFEGTVQGVAEWLEDDEDNRELFKGLFGFGTLGEAQVGVGNFDALLKARANRALLTEGNNEQALTQFQSNGGIVEDGKGRVLLKPSRTVAGGLMNVPTEKSKVAVYDAVAPAPQGLETSGFFLTKDDRGVPGVTQFNVVRTTVPDQNGNPVTVSIPGFTAIQTPETNQGDVIAFSFDSVFNGTPNMFVIPVENGALKHNQRRPLNVAEYARTVAGKIDRDGDANDNELLLKSIDAFRSGIGKEMKKAKGDEDKLQKLNVLASSVDALIDTMTVFTEIGVAAPPSGGGQTVTRKVRRARTPDENSPEHRALMQASISRYLTEVARFNAIMTNSFTGVDRGDRIQLGEPEPEENALEGPGLIFDPSVDEALNAN